MTSVAPLTREAIAETFERVAFALEIHEANPFRIRAFRHAAQLLGEWSGDLDAALETGTLTDLEGIGPALARAITELRRQGHSTEVDEVLAQVPAGVFELRQVSGLGPRRVALLYRELGVDSLATLREACRAGRVRTLRGLGARTEERLLARVERLLARPTVDGTRPPDRDPAAESEHVMNLPPKNPQDSSVEMRELVLPNDTNTRGAILGGKVLHLMDVACAMAAMRHARRPVVTAAMDHVEFHSPIPMGHFVILKATVNHAGRTSMEVGVKVLSEDPATGAIHHTSSAYLTFVALGDDGHPCPVPPVQPVTPDEQRRFHEARARTEARRARRIARADRRPR